jgi:hypothetical protein
MVPPPQKGQATQSKAGGNRLRKKQRQAGSITVLTRPAIIIQTDKHLAIIID